MGGTAIVWSKGLIAFDLAILTLNIQADSEVQFRTRLQDALETAGWFLVMHVPVENRGDGHSGFVDMVAYKDRFCIGIEVDRCSARIKSKTKLESLLQAGSITGAIIAVRDCRRVAS